MKHVDVYIRHSITNMRAEKARYAYVIVFQKSDGTIKERYGDGYIVDTTKNEIILTAVNKALSRMIEPVDVNIYMNSQYIRNMVLQEMPEKWNKNGYVTAKGNPVTSMEQWQQLLAFLRKHVVKLEYSENNSYSAKLDERIKEM